VGVEQVEIRRLEVSFAEKGIGIFVLLALLFLATRMLSSLYSHSTLLQCTRNPLRHDSDPAGEERLCQVRTEPSIIVYTQSRTMPMMQSGDTSYCCLYRAPLACASLCVPNTGVTERVQIPLRNQSGVSV
jgi:hypothetical protein